MHFRGDWISENSPHIHSCELVYELNWRLMLRRALPDEVDSSIVGTRGIQDSLIREGEKRERETYRNFIL